MQILEPSRPTPKCEHFHIDIRAQRQALGNVCVHSLHVRVRACVLVWNCVCEHALAQSVLTVRACLRACEGFNCGFPFDSVHAFPLFFLALVKCSHCCYLLLTLHWGVPALPLANPKQEREFTGQGWWQFTCKCLLKDSVVAFKVTVYISGEIICLSTFSSFSLWTNARRLLPEHCTTSHLDCKVTEKTKLLLNCGHRYL